jgi:hypothetical protein
MALGALAAACLALLFIVPALRRGAGERRATDALDPTVERPELAAPARAGVPDVPAAATPVADARRDAIAPTVASAPTCLVRVVDATTKARACHDLLESRLELAPCARLEYGRLWGRGRNLEGAAFSGGATWLALLAAVKVGFEVVDPLSAVLELAAGAPLLAAEFAVDGLGQAHETPDVFGRVSFGAELAF